MCEIKPETVQKVLDEMKEKYRFHEPPLMTDMIPGVHLIRLKVDGTNMNVTYTDEQVMEAGRMAWEKVMGK